MTTSTVLSTRRPSATAPSPSPALVQVRRAQAAAITVAIAVFSVAFVAWFGGFGLFVLAISAPFPLLLLWRSTDVLRSDEASS